MMESSAICFSMVGRLLSRQTTMMSLESGGFNGGPVVSQSWGPLVDIQLPYCQNGCYTLISFLQKHVGNGTQRIQKIYTIISRFFRTYLSSNKLQLTLVFADVPQSSVALLMSFQVFSHLQIIKESVRRHTHTYKSGPFPSSPPRKVTVDSFRVRDLPLKPSRRSQVNHLLVFFVIQCITHTSPE